jgi:ABC-type uncharacterized transport system auxiliary subunit
MDSYSLFGRVNNFEEIDYDGDRKAFISICFELTTLDQREPLLTTTIEKETAITGGSVEDIVAAMSQATKLVFDQLATEIDSLLQ